MPANMKEGDIMAKKKAVKKRAQKKKPKPVQRRTITERERIEHLIKMSERNITDKGNGLDLFFTQQVERLKKELSELK